MPNPDELRAACERLRRLYSGEDIINVYPHYAHLSLDDVTRHDLQITSDAYLAEHDPTPLTLDVLREELGEGLDKGAFVYWEIGCSSVMWSRESIYCPDHASFRGIRITTLGQLRRAISLAEGV